LEIKAHLLKQSAAGNEAISTEMKSIVLQAYQNSCKLCKDLDKQEN
jgi:hypothetical protein